MNEARAGDPPRLPCVRKCHVVRHKHCAEVPSYVSSVCACATDSPERTSTPRVRACTDAEWNRSQTGARARAEQSTSSSAIDTREAKTVYARQWRREGTHALRRKAEVEPISLRAHGHPQHPCVRVGSDSVAARAFTGTHNSACRGGGVAV